MSSEKGQKVLNTVMDIAEMAVGLSITPITESVKLLTPALNEAAPAVTGAVTMATDAGTSSIGKALSMFGMNKSTLGSAAGSSYMVYGAIALIVLIVAGVVYWLFSGKK